jgi:hypothetical protein
VILPVFKAVLSRMHWNAQSCAKTRKPFKPNEFHAYRGARCRTVQLGLEKPTDTTTDTEVAAVVTFLSPSWASMAGLCHKARHKFFSTLS